MNSFVESNDGAEQRLILEAFAEKLELQGHLFEIIKEGYYVVSFSSGKYGFFTIDGWIQGNRTFRTNTFEFDSISECEIRDTITIEFIVGEISFSLTLTDAGIQEISNVDIGVGDILGSILAGASHKIN